MPPRQAFLTLSMALCDHTEFKLPSKLGLTCNVLTGTAFHALIDPGVCLYGGIPGEQQRVQKERGCNTLSWNVLP